MTRSCLDCTPTNSFLCYPFTASRTLNLTTYICVWQILQFARIKKMETRFCTLPFGVIQILFLLLCVLGILQQNTIRHESSNVNLSIKSKQNSDFPSRDVIKINCICLTIQEVNKLITNTQFVTVPNSYYIFGKKGYIIKHMTSEEDKFPIAYIILMY